jgi:PAS domain S-box-containing protein
MHPLLFQAAGYAFNIFSLPPLAAALAGFFLGIIVLSRGRNKPSLLFLILSLSLSVWFFTFALMYSSASAATALVWARLAYLGVPFIPALSYHIALESFGGPQRRQKLILAATWLLSGFSALAALRSDWLITGLYRYWWGYYPRYGWYSFPFLLIFGGTAVVTYLHYREQYRHIPKGSPRYRKLQATMLAYLVVLVGMLDFLPKFGIPLYPLGYLPFFIFLVILSRHVWQHGLIPITPAFAAESIIRTMTDALLLFDVEGIIQLVNPAFCALFDLPARKIQGEPLLNFLAATEGFAELATLLTAGEMHNVELACRLRGQARTLNVSSAVMRDPSRVPVATLLIIHDLTERKQAERALQESEERYSSFVENFRGIVFRGRLDFTSLFFHGAVQEITGYSSEDFESGRLSWDRIIHPDDLTAIKANREIRERPGYSTQREYRILRRDGQARWITEYIQNVCDHDNRPVLVQGVIYDISDRKLLEEQLEHSQKLESIGRLAGGMAHDFNNLMTSILGYSELLLENPDITAESREHVLEIKQAVDRATALTGQLLTFSRKQIHKPAVIDLNRLLENLEKLLRPLLNETISLEYALDPNAGCIKADPGQIEQVVMNLAVNAKDAMPGGGRLRLETRRRDTQEGDSVLLVVSDSGEGMQGETIDKIFEPFFTTKEQGKGTGLGLATVYGIVRQSGGYIEVTSVPGKGSAFTVVLPRVQETEIEAPPAAAAAAPAARTSPGRETILVVEDEPALARVMERFLSRSGYTVLLAGGGRKALERFDSSGPVDLLVTDVVMPGMSGPDLAEQLQRRKPGLKVLYISGYTDNPFVRAGIREGSIAFLAKPFTPDALCGAVRAVLDRLPASWPADRPAGKHGERRGGIL